MDKSDDQPVEATTYMPIDASGGAQPVLSGLTVLVPGVLVADRYRLGRADGRVGEASRWQAVDESLSRGVVVLAFANGQTALPALEAARQASGAADAHFLKIFDAGQDADGAYVVAEATTGASLGSLLTYGGPLPGSSAAWLVQQVAAALASAHALHLYHLCLSPSNVFVTATGAVKIAGLMVEQALTPATRTADLTRAAMEQADVAGCGRLLYACLTATWPGERTAGLAAAPRTEAGFPSPLQVQPATAPVLNKLTYQMLSAAAPGHLTSVQQVAEALADQADAVAAPADLAKRQELAASGQAARPTGAKRPTIVQAATPGDQPIPATETVAGAVTAVAAAAVGPGDTPENTLGGDTTVALTPDNIDGLSGNTSDNLSDAVSGKFPGAETSTVGLAPTEVAAAAPLVAPIVGAAAPAAGSVESEDTGTLLAHNQRLTKRQVRRWSLGFLILVALVILAIVSAVILGLYRGGHTPPAGGPTPLTIVAGQVFDPTNDGGSGDENDAEVPLAFDGNPATAWSTENYHTATYIPDNKPGVGLVLDLGSVRTVSALTVTVDTLPTTLGVYVPKPDPAAATSPPMDSVASWQELTTVAPTTTTVTISFTPTDTRFVLLYISQLPPQPPSADGTPNWALSIQEVSAA